LRLSEGIASPIGRTAAASLRRTVIDDAVHFTTEAIVGAGPPHNLPALQGIQIARTMYRTPWCSAPPSSITFPPLRPPAIDSELARTWQMRPRADRGFPWPAVGGGESGCPELDNGASASAIAVGSRSITSMGLASIKVLVMGTRAVTSNPALRLTSAAKPT
jgi:acetate kinase